MKSTITRRKKGIFLKIVIYTITIILLYNFLIIGLTEITNKKNKGILGFRAYIITTESMKPSINPGDIIVIKEAKDEDLNVNDIVTVETKTGINTHRIVRIEPNLNKQYVIKGDNNNVEDEGTIEINQILGKMIFRIPALGKIAKALQDEVYVIIIIIILLQIFIHYQNTQEKNRIRREKKEKEDEIFKENNNKNC